MNNNQIASLIVAFLMWFALFGGLFAAGCEENNPPKKTTKYFIQEEDIARWRLIEHQVEGDEKHVYILRGYGRSTSMTHYPECPCYK